MSTLERFIEKHGQDIYDKIADIDPSVKPTPTSFIDRVSLSTNKQLQIQATAGHEKVVETLNNLLSQRQSRISSICSIEFNEQNCALCFPILYDSFDDLIEITVYEAECKIENMIEAAREVVKYCYENPIILIFDTLARNAKYNAILADTYVKTLLRKAIVARKELCLIIRTINI